MQIDHELMGKIAGVFATLGFLPYIVAIFKNTTVPSKTSWIIWTVVGTAIVLSYKTSGANASVWVAVSYAICPAFVLVVALFKNREREPWPKLDKICLIVGLILFAPWATFKVIESVNMLPAWARFLPLITLFGGLAVDAFGAIPTISKSWKKPEGEDLWAWTFWCTGNIINLFAVETWNWEIATYAVYVATPSVLIMPPLLAYRLRTR